MASQTCTIRIAGAVLPLLFCLLREIGGKNGVRDALNPHLFPYRLSDAYPFYAPPLSVSMALARDSLICGNASADDPLGCGVGLEPRLGKAGRIEEF